MTDATLSPTAAPARRLRPTEEPAWLRRTLIGAVLIALVLLVIASPRGGVRRGAEGRLDACARVAGRARRRAAIQLT
jgi:hypothetical protein